MKKLTLSDLNFILESLKYTKCKFEDYPIGKEGYPDYEFKQKRIKEVELVSTKVRDIIKAESKEVNKKPAKKASNTFHNIMQASVKGNPKPKKKEINKKSL